MKALAFVIGLCIAAIGAIGLLAPAVLLWIGGRFGSPTEWYAIGVVRVAFGLLLFSVAKTSRSPRALRAVAFIPLLAGIAALVTPLVGLAQARAAVEWWSRQGPGVARLTALPLIALGGFVAYACSVRSLA
jgi:hypothetical protein